MVCFDCCGGCMLFGFGLGVVGLVWLLISGSCMVVQRISCCVGFESCLVFVCLL